MGPAVVFDPVSYLSWPEKHPVFDDGQHASDLMGPAVVFDPVSYLSWPEKHPVFDDGQNAGDLPGQVVLLALEGPVWAQDDRGQGVT